MLVYPLQCVLSGLFLHKQLGSSGKTICITTSAMEKQFLHLLTTCAITVIFKVIC